MAIKTIRLDDELLQVYERQNPLDPIKALVGCLQRFRDFDPSKRVVILDEETRAGLERLYGRPIEDLEQFLRWVRGLATLRVDEADITFTAGQKKAIYGEARAQGLSVADFLAREIPEMLASRWGY